MEIKGFLFFLGSLLRWPVQSPKEFLYFHLYIIGLYAATFFIKLFSAGASSFIFTVGVLAPLMLLIYKGLPLDCLNYKSAIKREVSFL
tara:strand:- start:841 stop:1104 length:264 start_codon:yes stop_codon:yes gene_type:complete